MDHLTRFLGLALLVFSLQTAQCKSLRHENEISSLTEEDINDSFTDILDCVNYTCTWCAKWAKKVKVCNSIGIAEETVESRADFSIVYNLTVNNNLVLSNSYPVSSIPPVCYDAAGVRGCLKVLLRKQERTLRVCGTLAFEIANSSLPEYDFVCHQIPSGNRPGRLSVKDSQIVSDEGNYATSISGLLESTGSKSAQGLPKSAKSYLENHGLDSSSADKTQWMKTYNREMLRKRKVMFYGPTMPPTTTRPPLPPIPVLPINPY